MKKVNIYRRGFAGACPNNNEQIWYDLEITTDELIMAEDICKATRNIIGFHEDIADALLDELGGEQTLTAHHHGVDIVTYRS